MNSSVHPVIESLADLILPDFSVRPERISVLRIWVLVVVLASLLYSGSVLSMMSVNADPSALR